MDNLKNYVNFFQLLTQYEIIIFLKTHNQTDILNLSTKMLHNLDFFLQGFFLINIIIIFFFLYILNR